MGGESHRPLRKGLCEAISAGKTQLRQGPRGSYLHLVLGGRSRPHGGCAESESPARDQVVEVSASPPFTSATGTGPTPGTPSQGEAHAPSRSVHLRRPELTARRSHPSHARVLRHRRHRVRGDRPAPRVPRACRTGGQRTGRALRGGLGRVGRVRRSGLVRQGPYGADHRPGRDPLPLDRPAPRLRRRLHRPAPRGAEQAARLVREDRTPQPRLLVGPRRRATHLAGGVSRLEHLHDEGAAPHAFPFHHAFAPDGTPARIKDAGPRSGGRRHPQ